MNRNIAAVIAGFFALFAIFFFVNYRTTMSSEPPSSESSASHPKAQNAAEPAINNGQASSPSIAADQRALESGQAPMTQAGNSSAPTPTQQARAALLIPDTNESLSLKLPYGVVNFSRNGGCLGTVTLNGYRNSLDQEGGAQLLDNYAFCKALGFRVGSSDLRETPMGFERLSDTKVRITQQIEDLDIVRTWDFGFKDYSAQLSVSLQNHNQQVTKDTLLGIELGATSEHAKAGGIFSSHPLEYRQIAFFQSDKVTRENLKFETSPTKEEIVRKPGILPSWIGSDSIYFLLALLPEHRQSMDLTIQRTGFNIQRSAGSEDVRTVYEAWLETPVSLRAGEIKSFDYKVYLGPKQRGLLGTFESRHLEQSIDYGFFRIVALPMYHILSWLHLHLKNWGVAIILLTLAIKILFFPLMIKAYIAGKKMQKIQPKLAEIRELYKEDKQKQQQEIMAVMSKSGVNPVSGCLPILPQIPVFFGLNAVLTHTFELRHAPFYGWIKDLSFHDPLFLSPVLMALLMYFQQKLTPMPSMEPAQQKLMQFMPLIFAVFMLSYPSGLVLYIITNSVVSLVQQKFMIKRYEHL